MSIPASLTNTPTARLIDQYRCIRSFSRELAAPLSAEDCVVQSMPDVSPTRWHLAHTTWFFETFVLAHQDGFHEFDANFNFLFNSYYNQVGRQFPRAQRGLVSRPGLARINQYRRYVDQHMEQLIEAGIDNRQFQLVQIGLHHEQQHQELMLTDIKHVLSCNPLLPVYCDRPVLQQTDSQPLEWIEIESGVYEVGHTGDGFSFDNESPRHRVYLHDCAIANHPVTCGEMIDFIEDAGYRRPEHWLSLGWATATQQQWGAPLYWVKQDGQWMHFTLGGLQPIDPKWPVCHLSYFEADALARWKGGRLPTEFEWEVALYHNATRVRPGSPQFADRLTQRGCAIHPTDVYGSAALGSMLGSVWEWTSSSYAAYPGYQPPPGAIGEYNGKFMCNQYVLRGGSCATGSDHIRGTYRNFFPPEARWQFSGLRLAR